MKYVFKQIDNYTPSETTIEFTADSLMTVLEQFEFFLKGSGFYFNGKLDIVNEDEWNEDNFQALCKSCNGSKTAKQSSNQRMLK